MVVLFLHPSAAFGEQMLPETDKIDHSYVFPGGGQAGCGESAPGASLVTTAFAFRLSDLHFFLDAGVQLVVVDRLSFP